MAELNGLEPSSAWLTTKCLTSRPQFRARKFWHRVPLKNIWVGRRDLNPQRPQSQCGALRIELRPTNAGDKLKTIVTAHFGDVVTFSIRPRTGRDDETRTRKSTD